METIQYVKLEYTPNLQKRGQILKIKNVSIDFLRSMDSVIIEFSF